MNWVGVSPANVPIGVMAEDRWQSVQTELGCRRPGITTDVKLSKQRQRGWDQSQIIDADDNPVVLIPQLTARLVPTLVYVMSKTNPELTTPRPWRSARTQPVGLWEGCDGK